jgi:AraC-like DNA-binding protein
LNPKYFPLPKTEQESVIFQKENDNTFYDILHFHEAIQITWIESGTGNCLAGNGMQRFEPDDIFVMGKNLPHVFRSDLIHYEDKSLKSEASTIFISSELINSLTSKLPEKEEILKCLRHLDAGIKLRNRRVCESITNISGLMGFSKIVAALDLLSKIFEDKSKVFISDGNLSEVQKESTFERINSVFDYTIKYFKREIKLEEVASLTSMTPNAFCKYFKQRTRKTYFQYLNDVRINHACRLLQSTETSIGEIAHHCGFVNFSNFHRQFQKRLTCSPSEYRKLQQG